MTHQQLDIHLTNYWHFLKFVLLPVGDDSTLNHHLNPKRAVETALLFYLRLR